jgi:surface polysaccharide O-acyltransferase-like enzyme
MIKPIDYITNLRVVATLCVVLLHVAADTLYDFNISTSNDWYFANILDGLVRFCVPVFVMISGVLLIKEQQSFGVFSKKRIQKVVIPFLFWFVIYFVFDTAIALKNHTFINFFDFFIFQVQSGSGFHFWYIYMIIALYVLIYLFSNWIIKASFNILLLCIISWVLLLLGLHFLNEDSLPYLLVLALKLMGYFGYALLGYFTHQFIKFKSSNIEFTVGILLFIIGSFATIYLTYYSSNKIGEFDDRYYEYLTINVAIQAVSILVMIRSFSFNFKQFTIISTFSYGIYLIHPLIIVFVLKLNLDHYFNNFIISKLVITLLAIFISFLAIKFMHKIPFLKRFAG